jgi:hypothetical protein
MGNVFVLLKENVAGVISGRSTLTVAFPVFVSVTVWLLWVPTVAFAKTNSLVFAETAAVVVAPVPDIGMETLGTL